MIEVAQRYAMRDEVHVTTVSFASKNLSTSSHKFLDPAHLCTSSISNRKSETQLRVRDSSSHVLISRY